MTNKEIEENLHKWNIAWTWDPARKEVIDLELLSKIHTGPVILYKDGHLTDEVKQLPAQDRATLYDTMQKANWPSNNSADPVTPADPEQFKSTDNPYQKYTDHLASVLQAKNNAYGSSFAKSLDEDGLLVAKIRIGDKFNRLSHLIKNKELKENDESLADTLEDLAGYAILTLKYIKENKNETARE